MHTPLRSLGLALVVSLAIANVAHAAEGPNVVLVMADDQGWGDMAYNGHPHVKTPHFDALSREGLRFDRFHSAHPVCSPTRGSVMTGRTPNRFGCFSWGHTLRPQEVTLAEALQKAGYRTGHFGKWHLGGMQKASPVSPGNSGFDTWVSAYNFFDINPILSVAGKAKPFEGDSSDITADQALTFIRDCARKKEKFLAVVWFGSPHAPHKALDQDRALYGELPQPQQDFLGEITAMDRAFGAIRGELKNLGLRDNTLLWYCSDNGALPKVGNAGGRRMFKGSVYEGGISVPGLVDYPPLVKAPRATDLPCVTSDIYPTVLELCGVKVEHQPPLDGVSLVPLLKGEMTSRPKPIGFWDNQARGIGTPSAQWMKELYDAQQAGEEPARADRLHLDAAKIGPAHPLDVFPGHAAWIDGNWKLHRIQPRKADAAVRYELYDLAADLAEANDVAKTEPGRVQKMKAELEQWLASVGRSLNGEDYAKAGAQ